MPHIKELTKKEREDAFRILYDLVRIHGTKSAVAKLLKISDRAVRNYFNAEASPSRATYERLLILDGDGKKKKMSSLEAIRVLSGIFSNDVAEMSHRLAMINLLARAMAGLAERDYAAERMAEIGIAITFDNTQTNEE